MVINSPINRNKETKILKKGGKTMQKTNVFKKVLCLVIAMMMIMPSVPAYTFAEELSKSEKNMNFESEPEAEIEEPAPSEVSEPSKPKAEEPKDDELRPEDSEEDTEIVESEPEPAQEPSDVEKIGKNEPETPVSEEPGQPEQPIMISYTINYLIEATNEPVPDLTPITGEGKAGDIIEISHPEAEGCKVLENQPTTIELTEETRDIVIYYEQIPAEINILAYEISYLIEGTDEPVPALQPITGEGKPGDIIEIPHPEAEGYKVLDNQPESFTLAEDAENAAFVYYAPIVKAGTLTVNHIILTSEGQENVETELLENLNPGAVMSGEELAKEEILAEGFEFSYSDPEEIEINQDVEINIYYQEGMGENTDNLSEPEYLEAPEIFFPVSLRTMSYKSGNNIEWPNPGALAINKIAETIPGVSNRWKVTLTLNGKNLTTTSDIVLVIDTSGSMKGDKLTQAKNAAAQFVNTLLADGNTTNRIAIVSFAGGVTVKSNFRGASEKHLLISAINSLGADGGTFTQAGIRQARALLSSSTAGSKNIVLLSDGDPTYSYALYNPDNFLIGYPGHAGQTGTHAKESDYNYGKTVGNGSDLRYRYHHTFGDILGLFDRYYNNGNSAIAESGYAKTNSTVYTIALNAGTSGNQILSDIASEGKSFTASPGDLTNIFGTIAGDIAYAAENSVITDRIGEKFTVHGINATNYTEKIHVSAGSIEWDNADEVITWRLGKISEGTTATMWYEVEIDGEGVETGKTYPTNGPTTVDYTDANGDPNAQKTFPVPVAGIGAGSIVVHHYRVNSEGQPINSEGVSVDRDNAELQSYPYNDNTDGTNLKLNKLYTVNGASPITFEGKNYIYNSKGEDGDSNPAHVTLTTENPTVHVWFAYTEVTEGPQIEVTGYDGVYDGASHSIEVKNIVAEDTVYYSTDGGKKWSEDNPTYTNVGTYPVDVKVTNLNYEDRLGRGTVTIIPKALEVAGNTNTVTYTGSEQIVEGFSHGDLVNETGTVVLKEGFKAEAKGTNVGTYQMGLEASNFAVMDGEEDVTENYTITVTDGWLKIEPAELTLTVTGGEWIYDGEAHTVTFEAIGIAEDAFTYEFSTDGKNWSNTQLSVLHVSDGEVEVYVKASNRNYIPVIKSATIKIIPKALTVTAKSDTKVYTGSEQTVTGYTEPTGLLADHVLSGITASGSGTNVGDYEVAFTGTPVIKDKEVDVTQNYKITLVPGKLTITPAKAVLTVIGGKWTYDGEYHTATYEATGVVAADKFTYEFSNNGETWSDKLPSVLHVSDRTVYVYVKASNPNYKTVEESASIKIVEKQIELTAGSSLNNIYNGSEYKVEAYEITKGSLVYGDSLSVDFSSNIRKDVGNQTVRVGNPQIKSKTAFQNDYKFTCVNGELSITAKAVVVKADNKTKVYGAVDPELTATVTGLVGEDTINYTLSRVTGENVGPYTITPAGDAVQGNYTVTYEPGTLTITAKAVVVKSDNKSKVRGNSDPELTATVTGLVGKDTINYTLNREAGESVGTYAITPSGDALQGNYTVTYEPGTFTITSSGGSGGGGSRPTPAVVIPDAEVPLAELEKDDHFAYVIGYPDGDVKPMNNITREEVAMIFYRLLTDESRNSLLSDSNTFTDLEGHGWSNRAISTLYNAGILSGYPDGTFRPSDPISRAEFATIAAKFDKLELNNTTRFTDVVGHWAEKYVTSSEIKGWVAGYPDLTFRPEQDITRAEAMTLINNVLERAVPEENIHPDAIFWPDMTGDDWYYEAVMEATNSHDYIYEEDSDELWTGIKANKVWP